MRGLARAQAAAEAPGSVGRMLLLAAFAVSAYSSTAGRTSKPFNPLLGETYELVHAQKGFRAVVEKVREYALSCYLTIYSLRLWNSQ